MTSLYLTNKKTVLRIMLALVVISAIGASVDYYFSKTGERPEVFQDGERPKERGEVGQKNLDAGGEPEKLYNVLLVGWDGAERRVVYDLLKEGKLPNLQNIVDEGSLADIAIVNSATETKPGWTEILTGYNASALGVISNDKYEPILAGYTVFERLENRFGPEEIVTVFIGGKTNNIGARGPHKICVNCYTRDPATFEKTDWWEEPIDAPVKGGGAKRILEERKGEPFFYAKNALDLYQNALGAAKNVGALASSLIEKYKNRRFFMFVHFEEPDEIGHKHTAGSQEYRQGIINNDKWLGVLLKELKKNNLYDRTLVYVVSDHGFDANTRTHRYQPEVFLATNDELKMKKSGERIDVTPSILYRLGFDLRITPPFNGKNLYE